MACWNKSCSHLGKFPFIHSQLEKIYQAENAPPWHMKLPASTVSVFSQSGCDLLSTTLKSFISGIVLKICPEDYGSQRSISDIRTGGESGSRTCKLLQKVGQNESKVFMVSLWLCTQMIVKVIRYLICFSDNLLVFIFWKFAKLCNLFISFMLLWKGQFEVMAGLAEKEQLMHSNN